MLPEQAYKVIQSLVGRALGARYDKHEVASKVWLGLWKAGGAQPDTDMAVSSSVVRLRCISEIRRQAREEQVNAASWGARWVPPSPDPRLHDLLSALDHTSLTAPEIHVLVLRFWQNQDLGSISRTMELSPKQTNELLSGALDKLRTELRKMNP